MEDLTRRSFIQGTATTAAAAAAGAALVGTSKTGWAQSNEKIRAAVIGIRGRGNDTIQGFMRQPNVEVVTICDIDEKLFDAVLKRHWDDNDIPRPKVETDLRRVMEDPEIDVVGIATPNHWHSLAAIWAIQGGKDVYVEKPCSHTVFEGRQLVKAARKYNRVVQHGTQIRSNPAIREAMQHLHDGLLGEVYMARGLCYRMRDTIGKFPDGPVPEGVNYDLWLGPAPERPFNPNRFHYNWHYMWDYGNGDIGNQGVHQMDVARWGLGVKHPTSITSMGGMYIFDDAKEVPNTIISAFSFPDAGARGRMMQFDTRPWLTNDEGAFLVGSVDDANKAIEGEFYRGARVGILFYGEKGIMVIDSYNRYRTYLGQNYEPGPAGNEGADHYANFIEAVRARDPKLLNAEIEEGHYSSALCHLGLISARVGRTLTFDPENEQILNDAEANALLTREYREPYVVPAEV